MGADTEVRLLTNISLTDEPLNILYNYKSKLNKKPSPKQQKWNKIADLNYVFMPTIEHTELF